MKQAIGSQFISVSMKIFGRDKIRKKKYNKRKKYKSIQDQK